MRPILEKCFCWQTISKKLTQRTFLYPGGSFEFRTTGHCFSEFQAATSRNQTISNWPEERGAGAWRPSEQFIPGSLDTIRVSQRYIIADRSNVLEAEANDQFGARELPESAITLSALSDRWGERRGRRRGEGAVGKNKSWAELPISDSLGRGHRGFRSAEHLYRCNVTRSPWTGGGGGGSGVDLGMYIAHERGKHIRQRCIGKWVGNNRRKRDR